MLKDFDIAFTNNVKGWYSNTIYANTALVYNVAFNQVDIPTLKLTFPMISIYRPLGFEVNQNQNFAARKRGIDFAQDEVNGKYALARFLSVTLPYQLDIYAKSQEDLDDVSENILQAFNIYQKLEVTQHDPINNVDYVESYDITYNNGPVEQSEFQDNDRVYHYSITYDIKNARLVTAKTVTQVSTVTVSDAIDEKDLDGNVVDLSPPVEPKEPEE